MLGRWQFNALSALGALALLLALVDASLAVMNRDAQTFVAQRSSASRHPRRARPERDGRRRRRRGAGRRGVGRRGNAQVTEETSQGADSRTLWVDRDASISRRVPSSRGPFVPLLLALLALTTWLAAQAVLLVRDRQQLELAKATLAPQEQAATKVRASLDEVASATAKLAAQGNANARVIVEQLRNRGITIHPAAASAPR